MKVGKELLKGSTVILVLTLLDRKDMYGYEMVRELEQRSGGILNLKEGTLYPILHSLESDGLVEAYWDEQGSRPRKYYRITGKGKKQLEERKQEWSLFSGAVNRVLGEGGAG
ncbi:helix-turn-helix transcriptional regulator [Cohnella lubricantis]|uniref:Helix-turn-helix transcriptional regulator n=1 Tax=Cohnella lubricantis TaxID=2163172 RepID=A0A841TI23_9BACL|nr:helix-turn-helix transcriptional regulator [Cohnella lubricantis]MBB6678888.1 helix-turn-helix transcriptional regulator [Cohnella lubricantis]MBP2120213.1 DNA-binding PadR family transcriptional regulator [Cohnella lubricantis]